MRENELVAAERSGGKKVKTDADDDDDRAAAFPPALNARWTGEGRSSRRRRRGIIWCTLFAYIK